jgi:Rieske Fe-S protein
MGSSTSTAAAVAIPAATAAAESPFAARPERRTLLRAAGLTGAACAAGVCLAACGGSSSPSTSGAGNPAGAGSGGATQSSGAGAGGSGTLLGQASQVPVGGGKVFAAQNVVVTQPAAGTYKAFSATCTHQGCQVNQVAGGEIECPCHGSHYSITDGSVQAGPAPKPLPAEQITVKDGQIFLA